MGCRNEGLRRSILAGVDFSHANLRNHNSLVDAVKTTGHIGVIGVFVPQDPGAADAHAKKGQIAFDFGKFWFKGQKMRTGNRPMSKLTTAIFVTSFITAKQIRL